MSSSRILREEIGRPYLLEPLGGPPGAPQQEPFRPTFLPDEQAQEVPEPVVADPPAPEPPPSIPEEEALAMAREAREEGVREGRGEAEARLGAASEALARALAEISSLRPRLLHDAEDSLLRLSVLIARKVMLREISGDPGIMAGLVRGALEVASEGGEIVLRLNPADLNIVTATGPFQQLLRENPRLSLKADPGIDPAGCLLETGRGTIDAGIDAQLDEILRRLLDERNARREDAGA